MLDQQLGQNKDEKIIQKALLVYMFYNLTVCENIQRIICLILFITKSLQQF